MTYLWKVPNDYPEDFIGRYARKESPDRFLFLRGASVPGEIPTPLILFDVPPDKLSEFDILPNSAMIPLVSDKVSNVLSKLWSNDVELIEAQVIANGKELKGYKLINATRLVRCVDHSNSDYVFIPNTDAIMKFNRLRLKTGCMAGYQVAREAEYISYLYVSELVKEVFESNKWRGYSFLPPESVHP